MPAYQTIIEKGTLFDQKPRHTTGQGFGFTHLKIVVARLIWSIDFILILGYKTNKVL